MAFFRVKHHLAVPLTTQFARLVLESSSIIDRIPITRNVPGNRDAVRVVPACEVAEFHKARSFDTKRDVQRELGADCTTCRGKDQVPRSI